MGKLYFTLKESFKAKKKLKAIRQKKHRLTSVTSLSPLLLQKANVQYLALDFDGVLAAHGQPLPSESIKNWLSTFCERFPQEHIFILSNKPTLERKSYFEKYFPKIRFIDNVRKKPYPDGLQQIQTLAKCKSYEIALVDDRLLTGCLACILAGAYPILITKPFSNFKRRPFQESFFGLLRWIEKKLFSIPS
ncbi:YqeG family HAD IIIA-type phosphatase [Fangia hongkongensis]|uniref:YqeG family HAD IIIA-type phosphatase n=1 Tax=Fangia hongkongensis TaxID=270495 RepID=UPI00036E8916|nr:hypothetical protein [Fangia hongkongensis]MBK2125143.1 HAD family hydrolase [Fangia hongkongensis]